MAGLEALGGMAAEVDADNLGPEAAAAAAAEAEKATAAESGAREWAAVPMMLGGLACMIAPELRNVYTEKNCLAWGECANQVAEKYNWNSPANMPELGLLACTASLAVPTFFLLRERVEEMRGGTAKGLLAKIGVWWRARKAAKAAAAAPDKGEGGGDGGEQ